MKKDRSEEPPSSPPSSPPPPSPPQSPSPTPPISNVTVCARVGEAVPFKIDGGTSSLPPDLPVGGRSAPKCSVCGKRLARKNCLQQACIQCCSDPSCAPHREAREALRREKAMLDGTDPITVAAAAKRATRVAPNMFHDPAIHYFGETVVLWDVREFMANQKWREDAVRRSRGRGGRRGGDGAGRAVKRKGGEEHGDASVGKEGGDSKIGKTEKPLSRRKRFKAICDRLYQESLRSK